MNSENFIENPEELNFKSHLLVGLYKITDIIKLPLFLLFSTQ